MVFFVLSTKGFETVKHFSRQCPVWLNCDGLSDSEIEGLRANGHLLTNFVKGIDPADQIAISTAIETIKQHHNDDVVWLEQ